MAILHVMVGYMGFGKSTLAGKLSKEHNAIILNHDEFMMILLGRNPDQETFMNYKDKIFNLIFEVAKKILKTGVDVIIDAGSWAKDDRKNIVAIFKDFADEVVFHQLNCPLDVAKQRVLSRSQSNYNELFIDENCFDVLLKKYQPISETEGLKVIYHQGS